jgi:hypothetical protein
MRTIYQESFSFFPIFKVLFNPKKSTQKAPSKCFTPEKSEKQYRINIQLIVLLQVGQRNKPLNTSGFSLYFDYLLQFVPT